MEDISAGDIQGPLRKQEMNFGKNFSKDEFSDPVV